MQFPIGFFRLAKLTAPNISIAGSPPTGAKIATATTTATGSTLYADTNIDPPITIRASPYSTSLAPASTLYAQSRKLGATNSDVVDVTNENAEGGL